MERLPGVLRESPAEHGLGKKAPKKSCKTIGFSEGKAKVVG